MGHLPHLTTFITARVNNPLDRGYSDQTLNPQKYKVLLIHDSHHTSFKYDLFPKKFVVTKIKATSMKRLDEIPDLPKLLESRKIHVIFVHLGFNDLTKGQNVDDLLARYGRLVRYLMNTTSSSICLSSILFTRDDVNLNDKISYVNKEMYRMVSRLRDNSRRAKEALFSYTNRSLGSISVPKPELLKEDGVHLTQHGTVKLMLNLKDALLKCLRLPRDSLARTSSNHQAPHISTDYYD